jgi:hypothetical protein
MDEEQQQVDPEPHLFLKVPASAVSEPYQYFGATSNK